MTNYPILSNSYPLVTANKAINYKTYGDGDGPEPVVFVGIVVTSMEWSSGVMKQAESVEQNATRINHTRTTVL